MVHTPISRRQFIVAGASGSAALPYTSGLLAAPGPAPSPVPLQDPGAGTWVRWLDGQAPPRPEGVTWGTPWARGQHKPGTAFSLVGGEGSPLRGDGSPLPLQSWPLAYWPDGSLKWTAHAIPADVSLGDGPWRIEPSAHPGRSSSAGRSVGASAGVSAGASVSRARIRALESAEAIEIDTGEIVCRFPRTGAVVMDTVTRQGQHRPALQDGRLVLLTQDHPAADDQAVIQRQAFESSIERVTLEQNGPSRALVRIEGRHAGGNGRRWLPFTLRFYLYAGSDSLRILHTIVFDGDESRDFITGIGLRFAVPLSGNALYDRHVRFSGEGAGLFAEAVRGLTGLRRDPGEEARQDQIAGRPIQSISAHVQPLLQYVPAFGDWTLSQATADSFVIRKRTRDGHSWLDADRGRRAAGLGYVGSPTGGVAFGIRNFWESHPTQLDIRGAADDFAQVTLWLWSPSVPAMDLRFYHDGMGQDTYEKQRQGLEITYEDYEPGFGTPLGIARTSELRLWALPATPPREQLVQLADLLRSPPLIVATPQTLQRSGVFARSFARPEQRTPRVEQIEGRLGWIFDFYRQQQDERGWYGFWNYGDVMHSYDTDRHVWRYDVGGFAWDNSELSTDIWLWLYFLRTGRPDVFRFAEAMTRHTGEVDVHHLGRFAPLGSRHNVMHWGCSAKQMRISTAQNRRYYYYLTGDERVGDLMREQIEAARTLRTIEPGRKLPDAASHPRPDPNGDYAWLGFGTDWGAISSAWLTEWERTGDARMRSRLEASMRTIAAQPRGFFTGAGRMNLNTGAFDITSSRDINVSHLSSVFGLPEVCAELFELLPVPEFERAWLEYCELYNASPQEQQRALGEPLHGLGLQQGHARLTAFAAHHRRDPTLAARAWRELEAGEGGIQPRMPFESHRLEGPAILHPVDEVTWVSTNTVAQWGLAAIECLAFAGPHSAGSG